MTGRLLIAVLAAIMLSTTHAFSRNEVKVKGSYTYYLPSDITEKQGRTHALEQAKIAALSEQFGTYISSGIISTSANESGDNVSESFNGYTTADVAGVWVKTTEEKVIRRVEGDDIVLEAFVEGLARDRNSSVAEFDAALGRVDDSNRFVPTTKFKNRERFDIRFSTPQDGYVAIYAFDGTNNAARLLPDAGANLAEPVAVRRGEEYRFFQDCTPVMSLEPDEQSATLRITLLFMPSDSNKPFVLPIDDCRMNASGDVLGFSITPKTYVEWLNRMMSNPEVQRRDIHAMIQR